MSSRSRPQFIENNLETLIPEELGVQLSDSKAMISALKKQLQEDLQARKLSFISVFTKVIWRQV